MFTINFDKKVILVDESHRYRLQENPLIIFDLMRVVSTYPNFLLEKSVFDHIKTSALNFHSSQHKHKASLKFGAYLLSRKPSKGIKLLVRADALGDVIPELMNCKDVLQPVEHHTYDVLYHSIYACDFTPPKLSLRLAGLFHDVGKPVVYDPINKTFHNHEVASASIVKIIFPRYGFTAHMTAYVSELVRNHMYNYSREWKSKTVLKFASKVGIKLSDLDDLGSFPLFQLRRADRMANQYKAETPITNKQQDFEERIKQLMLQRPLPARHQEAG